jgi:DNA-binding NtrC family response regulator
VFPIRVPPLRERPGDIPLLVWRFVEEFATAFGKQVDSISKDDMAALQQYSWPGNIRELRNVVERAMIMGTGRRLTFPVPAASTASASRSAKLEDVEREHIRTVCSRARAGASEWMMQQVGSVLSPPHSRAGWPGSGSSARSLLAPLRVDAGLGVDV